MGTYSIPSIRAKILIITIVFLRGYSAQASDYLFRNGRTEYSIVLPAEASHSERTAALELQKYVQEISGVLLNIVDGTVSEGKRIYLGYHPEIKAYRDIKRYNEEDEGFTYRKVGYDLIICGGRHRGTMYGVFSFLENELGVRWYTPKETVVPKRKRYNIPYLDHSETPTMKVRFTNYNETTAGGTRIEWSAHNKENMKFVGQYNEYGDLYGFNRSHTMGIFVPSSEYFGTHPEYFAFKGGKRIPNGQLCLSNPDVLQICIAEMKTDIETRPTAYFHSLSQIDSYDFCECDECKAIEAKYGGHAGLIIWFVNQVADAIKDDYPKALINTYAYQYSVAPPKGIVPRDNVVVILCTTGCCFAHPFSDKCCDYPYRNSILMDNIEGWSKICKNFFVWSYIVNFKHPLAPYPNFQVLGPNILTLAEYNVFGMFEGARYEAPGGSFSELRNWIALKLMWNSTLDVDSLAKDFIYGYYGEAAKYIWKYYTITQALVKPENHFYIWLECDDKIFTDEYVNQSMSLLNRAMRVVDDGESKSRVERVFMQILYLKCLRNVQEAKMDGTRQMLIELLNKQDVGVKADLFTVNE